jgi:superfamily II DNA or RNA helicase
VIIIKESVFIPIPDELLFSKIIKDNEFLNPRYAENERKGRRNWHVPRIIKTYSLQGNQLILPCGYLPELLNLLQESGTPYETQDHRVVQSVDCPELKDVIFREYQTKAINEALQYDIGCLVSPTGSGKSFMGLELIRQRKQKALILVHRIELADQWAKVIKERLNIKPGRIGNGKWTIGDEITIGLIQTLSRNQSKTKEIGVNFGLILCDEAHHCPAQTFFDVLSWLPAKHKYGLTATPCRSDGLEQLIYRSIGPIVTNISKQDVEEVGATVPVTVQLVNTGFNPGFCRDWEGYLIALSSDANRNLLIIDLAQNGNPTLILTDRIAHAQNLSSMLERRNISHVLAHGRVKNRDEIINLIKESKLTIGTTGLLGEGIDVSHWSVLVLASPVSSEIKLMQAIGRIVRPSKGKENGLVYDLRDDCGFAGTSFKKRLENYKKYGIWVDFTQKKRAETSGSIA